MLGQFSIERVNRFASLGVIPLMLVAIAVFSRAANGSTPADPPDSGTLVVANLRTETITFVDLSNDLQTELALPGPPHEIAVSEGRLYITLGRGNSVVEVDPGARAIMRILALDGEPHGIAVLGGNLYVTLDKANQVVVIDRATMTEIRRLPTGNTPHVIAASRATILVTDSRDNAIRQLEPDSLSIASGGQPEGIAIVGSRVVTADNSGGTVTLADAVGLGNARTVAVGALPVRALGLNGTQALVALQGPGEVAMVDVATGNVNRRLHVASRPDGLCLSPDRSYLAVASNAEGIIDLFATARWHRAPSLSLSPGLGACAWLPPR
ncbi:MAG: YncE family protein [bacterium]